MGIDFGVLRSLWKMQPSLPPFNTDFWFQTKRGLDCGEQIDEATSELKYILKDIYFYYKTFKVDDVEQYFALVVKETKKHDADQWSPPGLLLHDDFDDDLLLDNDFDDT